MKLLIIFSCLQICILLNLSHFAQFHYDLIFQQEKQSVKQNLSGCDDLGVQLEKQNATLKQRITQLLSSLQYKDEQIVEKQNHLAMVIYSLFLFSLCAIICFKETKNFSNYVKCFNRHGKQSGHLQKLIEPQCIITLVISPH